MPEPTYNNNDMQRMERLMERLNDKIDNVIATLTLVQTNQAVQNTQIINIHENARMQDKEMDAMKLAANGEFAKRDLRIDQLETNQTTMRVKVAPIIVAGTIVMSVLVSSFAAQLWATTVSKPNTPVIVSATASK